MEAFSTLCSFEYECECSPHKSGGLSLCVTMMDECGIYSEEGTVKVPFKL
jgi:hypothetical protein